MDILLRLNFYFPWNTNFSRPYWLLWSPNFHLFPNTLFWIVYSLSSSHLEHLGYYPWNLWTWWTEVVWWSSHPQCHMLWYSPLQPSLGHPQKNLCWCYGFSYYLNFSHFSPTLSHFGYLGIYQTYQPCTPVIQGNILSTTPLA